MPSHLPQLSLSADEVHLWFAVPEEISDPGLLQEYVELLADEERVQQQRFVLAQKQHDYLIARALVRCTLSRYTSVEPRRWCFSRTENGRPEIAGPSDVPPLRFSLSHTEGLMLCGVTLERDLGVDVEPLHRPVRVLELAQRFFCPEEARALQELPEEERPHRFFALWTLKEAMIKAQGRTLSPSLGRFCFEVSRDSPRRISFSSALDSRFTSSLEAIGGPWQFVLFEPEDKTHLAAVVARAASPLRYISTRVVPLLGEQALAGSIIARGDNL